MRSTLPTTRPTGSTPESLTFEYQAADGLIARKVFTFNPAQPYVIGFTADATLNGNALNPSVGAVALLSGACGFAMGGLLPVATGQFVRCLPDAFRARAFGVVQTGLQLLQGAQRRRLRPRAEHSATGNCA